MTRTRGVDPIVKAIDLNAPVEKAFNHFTKNIHVWWPLATHSLSQADAETVIFEARTGGRVYEIEKSGREREWGRVLQCEPPHSLIFSWVLEAPEKATEVEVRFEGTGEGKSRMTLTHRGWDNRPDGAEWRGKYNEGWNAVGGAIPAYPELINSTYFSGISRVSPGSVKTSPPISARTSSPLPMVEAGTWMPTVLSAAT